MLNQKLVITYSNQRLREHKANHKLINPIDKILTLDDLIVEEFEKKNFKIIIDDQHYASTSSATTANIKNSQTT